MHEQTQAMICGPNGTSCRERRLRNRPHVFVAATCSTLLLIGLVLCGFRVHAQETPTTGTAAVVTGAQSVYMRRGPGMSFPPFVSLPEGTEVRVLDLHGEWARVSVGSGQVGYMNSNFLALPGDHRATPPPTVAAAAPAAAPPATVAPATGAAGGLAERNQALEEQVHDLQQQLAQLQNQQAVSPKVQPTGTASTSVDQQLRTEVARLTAAVDALQRRLSAQATSENGPGTGALPSEQPPQAVSPTALLFGAVGLVIGWLLGTAYGRRQERGRRSRIRF